MISDNYRFLNGIKYQCQMSAKKRFQKSLRFKTKNLNVKCTKFE